jgi:hypothetical protein
LRPRVVDAAQKPEQPGQIAFDDRGNAIYEWQDDSLTEDGAGGDRARRQGAGASGPGDRRGRRSGERADPLQSEGTAQRLQPVRERRARAKGPAKKRDLRELSKWMEAKKNAKRDGQEE